jgi:hypothetical protein
MQLPGQISEEQAMCSPSDLRANRRYWRGPEAMLLTAGFACLQALVVNATAGTREATTFSVPAGSPDEYMQAGAAFAHELDPNIEVSFWDSQSGSLSVSRVEGEHVRCIVRTSPELADALKPLGRFLSGRVEPRV